MGTCLDCSLLFCWCRGFLVLENSQGRDLVSSQKNGQCFVCPVMWRDRAEVFIALSSPAEVSEPLVSIISHHCTMWNSWNLLVVVCSHLFWLGAKA